MLDLLLVSLAADLKGFSGSNPPPPEYQCGQYPVHLHVADEEEHAMRVGYLFVDGRVLKGDYHSRCTY